MRWRNLIASFLLAGSLFFAAGLSAQTSSVEGNVIGTQGRPLKDAEVRFEEKTAAVSPIIGRTDSNGRYAAALPRGMYKMTVLAGGKLQASITVKSTGANSRIDFDLRPSAEKQIRHYIWVGGETGSHIRGHWVEEARR
jgi:Carboxypeptidase regulatory-like domain